MRKSDIVKLGRGKPAQVRANGSRGGIAPDARERLQERETREAVNLSRETINALADAVAGAIVTRLEVLLPICARLAAADTIHTVQKLETVLRGAVSEGEQAAAIIKGVKG
jgi:hypothetical protein